MEITPELYEQIKKMIREESRVVATEVYEEMGTQYGVASVPAHEHNGVDTNKISPSSITSFIPINGIDVAGSPAKSGVFSTTNLASQLVNTPTAIVKNPATTYIPQIPIIYGHGVGVASQFNGGEALDGTMIFFDNGASISGLWVKAGGVWYGIGQATVGYSNRTM